MCAQVVRCAGCAFVSEAMVICDCSHFDIPQLYADVNCRASPQLSKGQHSIGEETELCNSGSYSVGFLSPCKHFEAWLIVANTSFRVSERK